MRTLIAFLQSITLKEGKGKKMANAQFYCVCEVRLGLWGCDGY